jgi:hypothetical protein
LKTDCAKREESAEDDTATATGGGVVGIGCLCLSLLIQRSTYLAASSGLTTDVAPLNEAANQHTQKVAQVIAYNLRRNSNKSKVIEFFVVPDLLAVGIVGRCCIADTKRSLRT